MSPFDPLLSLFSRSTPNLEAVGSYLSSQWHNPGDILSILLLLGPEVVQRAVAQQTGRAITPVAFSFGCVAHAVYVLLSSVGDGHLMPEADIRNVLVIGAESGHIRTTDSWVLGRFLRDYDDRVDEELKNEAPRSEPSHSDVAKQESQRSWEGLRITILKFEKTPLVPHGVPVPDLIYWSGFIVISVQMLIAIVPWILHGHWDTFMITAIGNMLAVAGSSLPIWRQEKWACPKKGGSAVTITQGNGSRHAITVMGSETSGLDLEILARGTRVIRAASRWDRLLTALLALLWVFLLVTVAGMHQDTWYLFAIGLLGSLQNIVAAGAARHPAAVGLHFKEVATITDKKVHRVLKKAEILCPGVGTSLLNVFYPGSLRVSDPEDIEFWRKAVDKRMAPNKHGYRLDCLPPLMSGADNVQEAVASQSGPSV